MTPDDNGQVNNPDGTERVAAGSAAGAAHVDNVNGQPSTSAPADGVSGPKVQGEATSGLPENPQPSATPEPEDVAHTQGSTNEPTPGTATPEDQAAEQAPEAPNAPEDTSQASDPQPSDSKTSKKA